MKTVRVELTPKFLIYAIISLVVLLVGWELRTVLLGIGATLFISFIINAGLRPLVDSLQSVRFLYFLKPLAGVGNGFKYVIDQISEWKVGRPLAIFIIYAGLVLVLGFLAVLLASEFASQIIGLVDALPSIFQRVVSFLDGTFPFLRDLLPIDQFEAELGTFVSGFATSPEFRNLLSGENIAIIFNQTLGIFSSAAELLVSAVTVLIISVYMLQRRKPVYEGLLNILPKQQEGIIRGALNKIEVSLGSWLVGQLGLMLIIAVLTYLIILIPGFFDPSYRLDDFAFPIALLAGLLEAIPNIGPAITLILSTIIALGTSGIVVVLYIAVSFLVLQNLEGVFIVPMVMKRAVGIDPIMSILGIISGFQLAGVVGSILAIPIIGITQIILVSLFQEYKKAHEEEFATQQA